MRLYIENEAGKRTMMLLHGPTTVQEVKRIVEKAQGVPAAQQSLKFAGRDLPDESYIGEELHLDEYNTRQEVTLHLQRRLSEPRSVWLTSSRTDSGRQQHLEAVEMGSTMRDVMQLLTTRKLADVPFAPDNKASSSSNVVVRRKDGTTTRLLVREHETIAQLEEMILQAEGSRPDSLAFLQSPDGCLHVVFGPSAGSTKSSYPIYHRSLLPQPAMPVSKLDRGRSRCQRWQKGCV